MEVDEMTKEELFRIYSIDERHGVWEDQIDNWISVEIYRLMHDGELPLPGDMSVKWIIDFLDKAKNDMAWWTKKVMCLENWGSYYLTAKRMAYRYSEQILQSQ